MFDKLLSIDKWHKIVIGAMLGVFVVFSIQEVSWLDSFIGKLVFVYLGVPFAFALVGLVELVTGRTYWDISSEWDGLKGWQRGVLGVFIVLFLSAAIFFVIFALFLPIT